MIQMKFELHSIKMLKVIRSAIGIGFIIILMMQSHLLAKSALKSNPTPPARVPFLKFKYFHCNYSETYIYKNYSCFVKSYSRTVSTITSYVLLKKPMSDFYVR